MFKKRHLLLTAFLPLFSVTSAVGVYIIFEFKKPGYLISLDPFPHPGCPIYLGFLTFTNSLHVLIVHNFFPGSLQTTVTSLCGVLCPSRSFCMCFRLLCRFITYSSCVLVCLNKCMEVVKYLVAYTASESRK